MAKASKAQKAVIERVMHEAKTGELKTSAGEPVKSRKQAVAIALHEAGASSQETPAKNKANLRKTRARAQKASVH